MALNNFIPTVWSETLFKELDKEYVAVRNCNREFEGDIRRCGDTVNIQSIGDVSVFTYTKNTDMTAPQTLDSSRSTLTISEMKGFNFQIDDVDKAQAKPAVMQAAMREAASALADTADAYVYKLYSKVASGNTITNAALDHEGVIDLLLSARKAMLENNVGSGTQTVLEVSPDIAAKILKAKILQSTDNGELMENGYLGSFLGFRIYVSNNIQKDGSGYYKCFARTKRAIAFAEQLSEVEAYRPEKRFADAVKGLHLYGAGIVYPKELLLLNLKPAA